MPESRRETQHDSPESQHKSTESQHDSRASSESATQQEKKQELLRNMAEAEKEFGGVSNIPVGHAYWEWGNQVRSLP